VLLCIDCGNTQTVLGLYDGADGNLVDHWRVSTDADRTSDEQALLLDQLLALRGFALEDVVGVSIASTAPAITAVLRETCRRYLTEAHLVVVGAGVRSGMAVRYDNPHEVGPDRIANAVAAYEAHGGPTIVVDFGTATIFDAISGGGEYMGGALFPGIEISLDALFGRASALRRVELAKPERAIGRSATESIQAGTVLGYASVVEGMCDRFEDELGGDATIVATGSLAELVVPLVDRTIVVEPWLTLQGLRLIYARNGP
jgi:type III pantothenate kinase